MESETYFYHTQDGMAELEESWGISEPTEVKESKSQKRSKRTPSLRESLAQAAKIYEHEREGFRKRNSGRNEGHPPVAGATASAMEIYFGRQRLPQGWPEGAEYPTRAVLGEVSSNGREKLLADLERVGRELPSTPPDVVVGGRGEVAAD